MQGVHRSRTSNSLCPCFPLPLSLPFPAQCPCLLPVHSCGSQTHALLLTSQVPCHCVCQRQSSCDKSRAIKPTHSWKGWRRQDTLSIPSTQLAAAHQVVLPACELVSTASPRVARDRREQPGQAHGSLVTCSILPAEKTDWDRNVAELSMQESEESSQSSSALTANRN